MGWVSHFQFRQDSAKRELLERSSVLSKRCDLCKKSPLTGNSRSHSNVATKRRQMPNLGTMKLRSDCLGETFKAKRICMRCRSTVDGVGVDAWASKNRKSCLQIEDKKLRSFLKRADLCNRGWTLQ